MLLRKILPAHHLDTDSKDVVKLGMALIATMSALVLGLLIASAKSSFDAQRSEFTQMSANVIQLDRILARYGPETKEARDVLRRTALSLDRNWSGDTSRSEKLDSSTDEGGRRKFLRKDSGTRTAQRLPALASGSGAADSPRSGTKRVRCCWSRLAVPSRRHFWW